MQIVVDTSDLERTAQALQFSARRTRAVIATALTRTAGVVADEWRRQFAASLDRPTPLTTRSVITRRADAVTLRAEVSLRDSIAGGGVPPSQYLQPQEHGGARGVKRFEAALQARGSMPSGMRAVPGPAAQLDAYGNVRRQQIVQVLNQLGTAYSKGYARVIGNTAGKRASAARRAGREYVAITQQRGGLEPGIYERRGRALQAVFWFVASVSYRKRLRLMQDGERIARARLQQEADRALRESVARLEAKR